MDKIKNSIGPFEIFSSFISGIPVILSLYIYSNVESGISKIVFNIGELYSVQNSIILIITSYVVGEMISEISWSYFKTVVLINNAIRKGIAYILEKLKITKKNTKLTRTKDWLYREVMIFNKMKDLTTEDIVDGRTKNADFLSNDFNHRLAVLIFNQTGKLESTRHVSDYLVPYVRQNVVEIVSSADKLMAKSIMSRNLSLGLVLFSGSLALAAKDLLITILPFIAIGFILAYWGVSRAFTFRVWWAREIIIGFYHHALKEHKITKP